MIETKDFASTIQRLKHCTQQMLIERQKIEHKQDLGLSKTASPSQLWSEVLTAYSYLINLSEEDFKKIRFHTELISGELIGSYWHPYPPHDPEEFARGLGYQDLLMDLPEAYWISEPPIPGLPKLVGVEYKGLVINRTVARHQIAIANFYHVGVLQSLLEAEQKQVVVEVGGGFGGLAHHLSKILDQQVTYILVDLPEMLLFQGAFLAVNNPEKSIYIYDETTFTPEFILRDLSTFHYALIPNFALNKLAVLQKIALMINMQSFQEMTAAQVQDYVEFGANRITHCFYSDNAERHPYNNSDLVSVSAILERYFDLYPSQTYYDALFKGTDWRWSHYYRKFFGFPKGTSRSFPSASMITMHHANDEGKLERTLLTSCEAG
jgi:hypothetical protein